tara:strand:+ start:1384 stop:1722 length:339 start_codon:yes stop_codon:yes gene_type:complete
MKFCKECESLLFPKEIDKELKYVCNVCGGVEDFTDYIIDTTVYKEQEKSRTDTNKNIIYDRTIPHTTKKKCPNETCETNKDTSKRDVVMVSDKYTQKLYYTCTVCCTEWSYG